MFGSVSTTHCRSTNSCPSSCSCQPPLVTNEECFILARLPSPIIRSLTRPQGPQEPRTASRKLDLWKQWRRSVCIPSKFARFVRTVVLCATQRSSFASKKTLLEQRKINQQSKNKSRLTCRKTRKARSITGFQLPRTETAARLTFQVDNLADEIMPRGDKEIHLPFQCLSFCSNGSTSSTRRNFAGTCHHFRCFAPTSHCIVIMPHRRAFHQVTSPNWLSAAESAHSVVGFMAGGTLFITHRTCRRHSTFPFASGERFRPESGRRLLDTDAPR